MESIFFGNKCTNVSKVKANVSYINILFVYIYICFIVYVYVNESHLAKDRYIKCFAVK